MTISVSPRVFISTPSAVACLRGIRNDRATSAAPRNLPAIAANRISPSCHRPSSPTAPTSTCRPATTKKTGNNNSRLICSSRSRISLVSAAAPPRGMIAPNTNAPKIACTPMTSVAQADSSNPARMTASMSGVSRPSRAVPGDQARQQRPDDQEHHQHECHRQPDDPGRAGGVTPRRDRDDQRQQRPSDDVVQGGTGEGQHTHLGPLHASLGEDPGEHRQRGDRQRDADEQHERQRRDRLPVDHVVQWIQQQGDRRPEREGQHERAGGDGAGGAFPATDQGRVEFQPDDEHEQDQPDLGDHHQERADVSGEQQLIEVAGQRTEQRGPERDPGEDLADDRGLADLPGQAPAESGRNDDDRDVQQDERDHVRQVHADGSPCAGSATRAERAVGPGSGPAAGLVPDASGAGMLLIPFARLAPEGSPRERALVIAGSGEEAE